MKKRKVARLTLAFLTVCIAAGLASNFAFGAEEGASWHINGATFTGEGHEKFSTPIKALTTHGTSRLEIPSKNAEMRCVVGSGPGINKVFGSKYEMPNTLSITLSLNKCQFFNLKTGAHIGGCDATNTLTYKYVGLPEELGIANNEEFTKIELGPECGVGVKVKIEIPVLKMSYGEETLALRITGKESTLVKYGAAAASFEITSYWRLSEFGEEDFFGYY